MSKNTLNLHTVGKILSVATLLAGAPLGIAQAGWDEGVAAFTSKNYQGAVQDFEPIGVKSPDNWLAQYLLGSSLLELDRKQEALNHLRKAYDLNPNDLSVKVALGRAYNALGQADAAQRLRKEAMQQIATDLPAARARLKPKKSVD